MFSSSASFNLFCRSSNRSVHIGLLKDTLLRRLTVNYQSSFTIKLPNQKVSINIYYKQLAKFFRSSIKNNAILEDTIQNQRFKLVPSSNCLKLSSHPHCTNCLLSTRLYSTYILFRQPSEETKRSLFKQNNFKATEPYKSRKLTMANTGPTLDEVIKVLNGIAPLHLAESWDNVGLLVEPSKEIKVSNILLTIDLTEKVLEESEKHNVNLILSYHPPIFRPFKSMSLKNWKEKLIINCIRNSIAVYSPHTALDAIKDGINDWLLSPFDLVESQPINQSTMGAQSIGHYSHRCEAVISENDQGLLLKIENCAKIQRDSNSSSVVIYCNDTNLPLVIDTLSASPTAQSTISLTKLEKPPLPGFGVGRVGILKQPISLNEIINSVKKLIGLNHVRLALAPKHNKDSSIQSIAVCAGSGGSVLRGQSVDLLITGEMSHHEVLDALYQNNSSVILCEHTNTERGYLKIWKQKITDHLKNNNVNVVIAQSDEDPLKVV